MAFTDEQKQYIDYLVDLMQVIGPVHARPMFGGHGIFLKGLMFGLIADDVLYLKADTESRLAFQKRDLEAFNYMKKGKAYHMSYFQAPDEVLEDPEEMADWASRAYAVALKANIGKTRK